MRLTAEIYQLFKDDLDEFLDEKQKMYLSMKDDEVELDNSFTLI
jgi:hypothetical protein